MHLICHCSSQDGTNAFFDENDKDKLSATAYHFFGGPDEACTELHCNLQPNRQPISDGFQAMKHRFMLHGQLLTGHHLYEFQVIVEWEHGLSYGQRIHQLTLTSQSLLFLKLV